MAKKFASISLMAIDDGHTAPNQRPPVGNRWFGGYPVSSGSPPGKHSFGPEKFTKRRPNQSPVSAARVSDGEAAGKPYGFCAQDVNGSKMLWWLDK